MKTASKAALGGLALVGIAISSSAQGDEGDHKRHGGGSRFVDNVRIGSDLNSAENPFVQPQDPALAGGGRDQTLQFGDVLFGNHRNDLINGRLGTDVMFGGGRNDVLIGGLEHFNPFNRDRAFGGRGSDIFIWKPGDGSDLFRGGSGQDAIVFGLTGEDVGGHPVFEVVADQQAGELFIDEKSGLPRVDVTNSPGFCDVIDENTSVEAAAELKALALDHLVRFSLRGVRDAFETGEQAEDNGLRVTLHLKDVEVLVCTNRDGGQIEILDLTSSPAHPIQLHELHDPLRKRLEDMLI